MTVEHAKGDSISPNSVLNKGEIFALTLSFAASAIISIFWQGFDFPAGNNIFHVPIVLDYFNSQEGPHDTFHRALQNYVSGFWVVMSSIVTERNIYAVFLAAHLITRFVILGLLFEIVRTLEPRADWRKLALAVAVIPFCLIATALTPVGRHEIFPDYLRQSHVVTIFVLASWLFALRQNWLLAAAALGLGFNVSAFVCVWSAVALGVARLWAGRHLSTQKLIRQALLMTAVFALLAFPTLYWILSTVFEAAVQGPAYDFRDFLLAYYPFHNFAFLQPHQLFKVILVVAVGSILLWTTGRTASRVRGDVLTGLFVALCAVFVLGLVLPLITGERLLLLLYPLRSDGYLIFLLIIFVLTRLAESAATAQDSGRASPFSLLILFGLVQGNLPLVLASSSWDNDANAKNATSRMRFAAALSFALLSLHTLTFNRVLLHPGMNMPAADAAAIHWPHWLLIAAIAASIPLLLREMRNALALSVLSFLLVTLGFAAGTHTLDPLWPPVLAYGMTALFFARSKWPEPAEYAFAIAALIIVIGALAPSSAELRSGLAAASVLFVLSLALVHWRPVFKITSGLSTALIALTLIVFCGASLSKFAQTRSLSNLTRHQVSWISAQRWARTNTAPDSLFLTPPGQNAFATLSRRPVWVDWKSGATSMWWPDYYATWNRRLDEIESLETLADWSTYADAHDINFIVFAVDNLEETEIELVPFVYRNRYYGITAADSLSRL